MSQKTIDSDPNEDAQAMANLVLSMMYQLKQQGIMEISSGDLQVLLGMDPSDIDAREFETILSLPDSSDDIAALCHARITNQIH